MPRKNDAMKDKILKFIESHSREKGYPPTVREICAGVGLKSSSTVHGYLDRMNRDGLVKKDSEKTRALRVVDLSIPEHATLDEYMAIPVIGTVTAGNPITAFEDVTSTFPLPMYFAKNKDLFMLKVRGESMINAGILDGDMVIVQKQPSALGGDIVVALLDDEATVKRFYKEKNGFRLQPENDAMEPIYTENLSILGKVVGVFRSLI